MKTKKSKCSTCNDTGFITVIVKKESCVTCPSCRLGRKLAKAERLDTAAL